jgi:uncharacterized NAD(P)/FAD-binding protein YdhS
MSGLAVSAPTMSAPTISARTSRAEMHADDVTIVGGGAAGVLLAAHLAWTTDRPLRVTVIDGGPGRIGNGTAYRTTDPGHLLNVRAASMSAWHDQPDHFVRWSAATGNAARPGDFVARGTYGNYLTAVAYDACSGPLAHVRILHCVATSVTRNASVGRNDPGWQIRLTDGTVLTSRHVVLATGIEAPVPLPQARRDINDRDINDRCINDPWRPGALDSIGDDDPVLLIGTGLTAIDLATTLARTGRRITAVSRHGVLPAAHTLNQQAPMACDEIPTNLRALRRYIHGRLAVSLATTGDWRPAVDGLRPYTQGIWQALDDRDRYEFLRRDRRRWESARHRMAPAVAATIAALRASGQLEIRTGKLEIRTGNVEAARDTWVINATGPNVDLTRSTNPVIRALFADRVIRRGSLGIGLDTTGDGQLRDPAGRRVPGLWTLGCTRRGQLWETTAIPEIRAQAHALAERLTHQVRTRPRVLADAR